MGATIDNSRKPHLVGMGPVLVLRAVGRIGEGLVAALVLAHVRLLSGMRPQVSLQVLQPGIGFKATLKLWKQTGNKSLCQSLLQY